MEDVIFQPRIMGPIDELKYMSLINFRRLDKDPFKAAEKIKEKINLLEEEYSKKVEGIKAWRSSPVNRLYLQMGEASISHKKPIDVIIEERRNEGKEYLNNKEFEAIINLNRELRF
jgi:dsDNA-specific endonuclease/ATPase MutS2